jgi:hypothetical protein
MRAHDQIEDTFRRTLSRVETIVYYYYISDYSSDVWAPVIGWVSGQLPGFPSP